MNEKEAVIILKRKAFDAFESECRLGQTVAVKENEDSKLLIHIFRNASGWSISAPRYLKRTDRTKEFSLREACVLVAGMMGSEHLPFKPEEVEITISRCVNGGDSSGLMHLPTRIGRQLFYPTEEGRVNIMTREEALDDIVFEISRSVGKQILSLALPDDGRRSDNE